MNGRLTLPVNIFAFYSATIFSATLSPNPFDPLVSARMALKLTIVFGPLNFACAWPAFFTIDRWGRRRLLLSTIPFMFLFLLIGGLLYLLADPPTRMIAVTVFVFIFVVAYPPGVGPIAFAYSAEVFPLTHRKLA